MLNYQNYQPAKAVIDAISVLQCEYCATLCQRDYDKQLSFNSEHDISAHLIEGALKYQIAPLELMRRTKQIISFMINEQVTLRRRCGGNSEARAWEIVNEDNRRHTFVRDAEVTLWCQAGLINKYKEHNVPLPALLAFGCMPLVKIGKKTYAEVLSLHYGQGWKGRDAGSA